MRGYIDIARWMLLDERIDPIDFNDSAIRVACREGRTDMVRALLADDTTVKAGLDEAIREIRGFDYVAIIDFLIEAINRDV